MSTDLNQFEKVKCEVTSNPYRKRNISAPKGFTLDYLKYRLLRPVYKLKYKQYQKAHPTAPWLTPDAIIILDTLLDKGFTALEYGSGRSTVFFSERVNKLYSVEHNEEWFNLVTESLKKHKLTGSHLRLIKPDQPVADFHSSSERQVFITEEEYPNKDSFFQTYVDFLDEFDSGYFDFIIVDGRARTSCALKAIDKLKPGGLMALDNSERVRYDRVHERLKSWPKIFTTTGLSDTVIWRKPS